MKIKYIVYLLIALGFAALVYYRISANGKAETGKPGPGKGGPGGGAPMQVDGVVLKPESFANTLSVTGSIDANEQVEIRSEVSGMVRKIYFTEGSRVKKGQVLVKIDDSELRARLAETQTRLKLTSENERRAGLLLEKEAISREEYDVAKAEKLASQAQAQLIQAQLNKTTIHAPFAGQIGLRNISEGAFLTPDVVVANLVNTDPLKISFSIPEKYANQVSTGTEVSFSVAGTTDKFKAKVYAIEPGIQESTRALQLRALADNSDGKLRPGSFANIEMPLAVIPDAILVPTQAVIPVQNGKKVFVSRNGKATEVPIETSARTASSVLIESGLKAGDTVITTGIMALKEKTPVKVTIKDQAAPVTKK